MPPIASSPPIARSSRWCSSTSTCREERVASIPNALDLRALDRLATPADAARARLAAGIGRDDVVLLSVGRIEENKGFHVLAAALGALAAHGGRLPEGRWRWVVIGDGPFRPRLERAIRDADLGRARHADSAA